MQATTSKKGWHSILDEKRMDLTTSVFQNNACRRCIQSISAPGMPNSTIVSQALSISSILSSLVAASVSMRMGSRILDRGVLDCKLLSLLSPYCRKFAKGVIRIDLPSHLIRGLQYCYNISVSVYVSVFSL
jgi:hypothetical protein